MTAIPRSCMRSRYAFLATPWRLKTCFRRCSCSSGAIRAPSIRLGANLAAWLAVIARNRAIDVLRRRKPETDIEDVIVSVAPDLAANADRVRASEKVRSVLQGMAPAHRAALEMAYFEGLSHSEIATKTGEPLGTIKTRIRAGLMALRKAFGT
jgi:RNA polymerase sigma factor (sigma-70 family)